ncbi:stromal interaction molecule homolog [Nilaparvata lugens]|uniref:stromal interaction molecule homolog n=1 Tax=Nilaparvata lugens TaxID=108931 RepID=UPI00193D1263|nr:stromal interaction molecule homolog [Nilaparvata lugens]
MKLLRKTLVLFWIIVQCSGNSEFEQHRTGRKLQSSESERSEKSTGSDSSPEMSSTEKLYRQYTAAGYVSRTLQRASSSSVLDEAHSHAAARLDPVGAEACNDDLSCLMMATNDRLGLEAIKSLHRQLDDDANGAVDLSESTEFLREELKYEDGAERRQRAFHKNDDMHISVKELWEAWLRSEVHNWTVEQTTEWLTSSVELPQYVPVFIVNKVTGASLPRLAASNMQFMTNVLGIKDPIHKQKIALKAMDVVLFGPPKDTTHYLKDLILVTLLLGALSCCWYAYRQNKNSRRHLRRMMKDMEGLHKAELALENLQKELERAKQEQENATSEKVDLERKLQQQRSLEGSELRTSYSDLEVSQLKAEIEMLRNELQRAEGELEDRCWSPPAGLQQWLQLTHEIENKAYVKKKVSAEKQLTQAREACEKLRKKRSSLVGAFVSTHGKTIDDVDRSIVEARSVCEKLRKKRSSLVGAFVSTHGKTIDDVDRSIVEARSVVCFFNGLQIVFMAVRQSVLYRNAANGRGLGLKGRMNSQDDLDDDASSYSPSTDRGHDPLWKDRELADSSESEKLDHEDDDARSNVQFTVGSSDLDDSRQQQLNRDDSNLSGRMGGVSRGDPGDGGGPPPPLRRDLVTSHSRQDMFNKSTRMGRSYSQDIQQEPVSAHEHESPLPKMSHSESNLEHQQQLRLRRGLAATGRSSSRLDQSAVSNQPTAGRLDQSAVSSQPTVDEETLSTDSNSIAEELSGLATLSPEKKPKKHKLHFPKFSRKSRATPSPPVGNIVSSSSSKPAT